MVTIPGQAIISCGTVVGMGCIIFSAKVLTVKCTMYSLNKVSEIASDIKKARVPRPQPPRTRPHSPRPHSPRPQTIRPRPAFCGLRPRPPTPILRSLSYPITRTIN